MGGSILYIDSKFGSVNKGPERVHRILNDMTCLMNYINLACLYTIMTRFSNLAFIQPYSEQLTFMKLSTYSKYVTLSDQIREH